GDAGGGLALAPVGSEATDVAAGDEPVESGSGGGEIQARRPPPTRIPTTLAPSNSERPTSAGMDTPCRRAGLYVNPTGGAPIAPPAVAAPAYATGATAAREQATAARSSADVCHGQRLRAPGAFRWRWRIASRAAPPWRGAHAPRCRAGSRARPARAERPRRARP